MAAINIDMDTFEHALKNLNKHEILLILQQFNWGIGSKQSKEELVSYLKEHMEHGNISEDMYYMIREKAFSINKNFYDGFFYKIDEFFKDLIPEEFMKILIERTNKSSSEKKISIGNIQINNLIMTFNFERSTKNAIYDHEQQMSRTYKQIISADIQIYFEYGLLYIHSKNLTESQIIKTFLDKSFQGLIMEKGKKKKVLGEPKFRESIAEEWLKANISDIKFKIENTSLQMLDLFYEFDSESSKFSNICMKGIYLKEDSEYENSDEAKITDIKFGGSYLQDHFRIIDEIRNGKTILGFKIEAEHLFEDEDTGEEIPTVLPITILYEDKKYLRLSISSEKLSTVKEVVLREAYNDIKDLFIRKFLSNDIFNTDKLKEYLSQDIKELVREKTIQEDKELPQKHIIQEEWDF